MSPTLLQDLEAILPFTTGAIYIFESAPFRPGDELYRVRAASADGDALTLQIDTPDGRPTELRAQAPEGATLRPPADGVQTLRIERARSIEWRLPWGTHSAHVRGDQVHIRTATLDAHAPDFVRSLTTALVLE